MQSARREILPEEQAEAAASATEHAETPGIHAAHTAPAESRPTLLQQQVAERLAAHRQRRGHLTQKAGPPTSSAARQRLAPNAPQPTVGESRYGQIAARIAERYAQSPSYRAILAEEAERSIQQAAAAAEVATRNAAAVVIAQRELLAELEHWTAPQEFSSQTAQVVPGARAAQAAVAAVGEQRQVEQAEAWPSSQRLAEQTASPVQQSVTGGLTVRLYEDVGRPFDWVDGGVGAAAADRASLTTMHSNGGGHEEEARVLDEEIAFRQAPVFDYRIEPTVGLPANMLEFPRQLVAARKVRPRLAEGPLREELAAHTRFTEPEFEGFSAIPAAPFAPPVWTSIWLDAHTVAAPVEHQHIALPVHSAAPVHSAPIESAPLELRMMATAMDAMLVGAGFVGFCAVGAKVAGEVPAGAQAGVAAAVTLAVFYALYQLLFFTLSEQTPGMRYARIGLCTFSDENPTRSAMRRRLLAKLVSLCPLGLGFVWALLDEDRLGWHDRISRMYQRAY